MSDPAPVEISPLAPIFGGEDIFASFADGTGTLLFIPQYSIRNIGKVLDVIDNECELLERVCSRSPRSADQTPLPANWVDCLTDYSHAELVEKARALNLARALAWAERQTRVIKQLQPLIERTKKG